MTTKRKLPDGWRWIKLGELADWITKGSTPTTYGFGWQREGVLFLRSECILPGKLSLQGSNRISLEAHKFMDRSAIQAGDVLMRITGDLGLSCEYPSGLGPANINQHVCRIRIRDSEVVLPAFVVFMLNSPDVLRSHYGIQAGSTHPHLSLAQVRALDIPHPPLAEQNRVAALLTAKMAAIAQARAAAQAQLQAAQALPAAYLRAIFNNSEAQEWLQQPLGKVSFVLAGITKGRRLKPGTIVYSVPYLRVANVQDGYLDLSEISYIEATESEIEQYSLKQGDLLLTEGGDPDKLGRGTFWENQIPDCIYQNHIFRVRFQPERVLPAFASAQIASPYGKAYFLANARQTTGIATINRMILSHFPLRIPPLAKQRCIVDYLESKAAKSSQVITASIEQLDTVATLPAAYLRRAFNGEL